MISKGESKSFRCLPLLLLCCQSHSVLEMQPFNLNFCLGKMTKLQGAKPHEQSEWLAAIVLIRTEQQQNLKCGLLATGIHCVCGKSPPSDTSRYRIESHC